MKSLCTLWLPFSAGLGFLHVVTCGCTLCSVSGTTMTRPTWSALQAVNVQFLSFQIILALNSLMPVFWTIRVQLSWVPGSGAVGSEGTQISNFPDWCQPVSRVVAPVHQDSMVEAPRSLQCLRFCLWISESTKSFLTSKSLTSSSRIIAAHEFIPYLTKSVIMRCCEFSNAFAPFLLH